MQKLPISLAFFTSTRGHFGRKTDWRLTLNHWDRQIPLTQFNLVAHVKTTPGDEVLGEQMADELRRRGFRVITTVGNWTRGLSHGANYLADMVRISKESWLYERPYFLLLEDDSPIVAHELSLESLLLKSCQMLAENHELVTVRTIRKGDYDGGVPQLSGDTRTFYSPNTDFQPLLMRSLDYYRLCMILESNPDACEQTHCELLWRLILDGFSRPKHRHLVWRPTVAEALHIGVRQAEHDLLVKTYNLT